MLQSKFHSVHNVNKMLLGCNNFFSSCTLLYCTIFLGKIFNFNVLVGERYSINQSINRYLFLKKTYL